MGHLQYGDNQILGLVVVLAGLMNEIARHSVSLWVDLPQSTLLCVSLLRLVFILHTDGENLPGSLLAPCLQIHFGQK